MSKLDHYIKVFSSLNTDRGRNKYPIFSKYRAPHKPILLLSVIDLIEEGTIKDNFIELSPDLGETFTAYWTIVMPPDKKGKIIYPFFHLRSENFWYLIHKPGKEELLNAKREVSSFSQLFEVASGAKLDEDLFLLLCNTKSRDLLRTVLINTYFDSSIWEQLISQSRINIESYKYSLNLLKKRPKVTYPEIGDDIHKEKVRDQGFRKAVVTAYNHRCAICGIRMRTPDGHTAVDGAHIIPWADSHNDLPQNGLSLCKLCHWTFDEGLVSISNNYKVLVSNKLSANNNIAGYLTTFESRDIIKPKARYLWPALDSLIYHQKKKFRQNYI